MTISVLMVALQLGSVSDVLRSVAFLSDPD